MPLLIGAGAAAVVLFAVVIAVLRRRRQPLPQPTLALPAPVGELERVLEARPSHPRAATEDDSQAANLLAGRPVRDRVLDAVRSDVDRTAGVLTAWLSETPRKGAK